MANLRAIRMRIKSVESTRQITRSMKMGAAAKLRKTQRAFGELRNFADKSREMLLTLGPAEKGTKNPLLTRREPSQKVCYVLLVGNRGLCGTYNHNLLRYLEEQSRKEEGEKSLVTCGRWGRDMLPGLGIPVAKSF